MTPHSAAPTKILILQGTKGPLPQAAAAWKLRGLGSAARAERAQRPCRLPLRAARAQQLCPYPRRWPLAAPRSSLPLAGCRAAAILRTVTSAGAASALARGPGPPPTRAVVRCDSGAGKRDVSQRASQPASDLTLTSAIANRAGRRMRPRLPCECDDLTSTASRLTQQPRRRDAEPATASAAAAPTRRSCRRHCAACCLSAPRPSLLG